MHVNPPRTLEDSEVLMLDMDGTVLDLAYDNFMWLDLIPSVYARLNDLAPDAARDELFGQYRKHQGSLEWYCLDHWSERLKLDVQALHREHRSRIGYLPGAREFLDTVSGTGRRLLLVTNSHRDTLDLKSEVTGLESYFDAIYSAHDVGFPKESAAFWQSLHAREGFDPEKALFIDDTLPVLHSARNYGIRRLLNITRPDTSKPARTALDVPGIEGLGDLA
ncbi:MAG: HAD-IA family hydrolase [Gammaproteobacteria bacterium]|nr:HAD-IA family hydrolase [Gammaproteobacteria bacterium]